MPVTFAVRGPVALPTGYTAQGVHFDGSTALVRNNTLTGVANSQQGTIVGSINVVSATAGINELFHGEGAINNIFLDYNGTGTGTPDTVRLRLFNAAGSAIVDVTCATHFNNLGWKTLFISWDLSVPTLLFYVGSGTSVTQDANSPFTPPNDTVSMSGGNFWTVGDQGTGINRYTGDMADFWFNPGTFFDWSVGSNVAKFYSTATGHLVDKGATGDIPTGSSPTIFFSGAVATWPTNDGVGGAFTTAAGALTASSTNP